MRNNYRHTKIVFTIGPASDKEDVLKRLIKEGVDICRFNMAHASHEWVLETAEMVRKCCKEVNRHIALLMDVKGPEIRTGVLDEIIHLEAGQFFDFYMSKDMLPAEDGALGVSVNYPDLIHDVEVGSTVLVDSGLIQLAVIGKEEGRLRCQVVIPGPLGNRRHINLPGTHVGLSSLTEKDHGDIMVGVEAGFDFYALSFVRDAQAVLDLKSLLRKHGSDAPVISKIEEQSGIRNLEEIVEASGGIMVARGDLGVECPFEDIPIIQQDMVDLCISRGKPVIVATHMLESMIENPIPTRSEVSDVAMAVNQKSDCIMLSGESCVGKYPLECVQTMNRISRKCEDTRESSYHEALQLSTPKEKMLRSAVQLATDIGNTGILVFTRNGRLPRVLSQLRPKGCPIYAFTDNEKIFRRMLILWGIEPFLMSFEGSYHETIGKAFERLMDGQWAHETDLMVVVTNVLSKGKIVDTVQLRPVSEGLMLDVEAEDARSRAEGVAL